MYYRELLKKYIRHVGYSEGVDFIDDCVRSDPEDAGITDIEIVELRKLSAEVWAGQDEDGEEG